MLHTALEQRADPLIDARLRPVGHHLPRGLDFERICCHVPTVWGTSDKRRERTRGSAKHRCRPSAPL